MEIPQRVDDLPRQSFEVRYVVGVLGHQDHVDGLLAVVPRQADGGGLLDAGLRGEEVVQQPRVDVVGGGAPSR
ncbi:hypothetical protein ACF06W_12860 [Streptomyces albus]|uniref:hypothetical protein n=1 Tax=Streptomyces albus TaxID=1888 RepID=UPI0036FDC303